jgi:hypothetical protein
LRSLFRFPAKSIMSSIAAQEGAHEGPAPTRRTKKLVGAPELGRAVLLTVAWRRSVEYILLDLEQLREGGSMETVERGNDWDGELVYEVTCTRLDQVQGNWVVTLLYDADLPANQVLAQDKTLQWGKTVLTIFSERPKATAIFTAIDGSVVRGRCMVTNAALLQNLEVGVATVLLRPGQAKLRRQLLQRFGECAISKESIGEALEVAHIIRHADQGAASQANTILLRADLHRLFDRGVIDITIDGTIDLSGLPECSSYRRESSSWNKRLEPEVLGLVQDALVLRVRDAEEDFE